MAVVPFRDDGRGPAAAAPASRPPDPTFALMAAAQMHSEGRLVKSNSPTKAEPNAKPAADKR